MTQPTLHAQAASHQDGGGAGLPLASGGNLVRVGSRRWFLQAGLAGLGGLALGNKLLAGAGRRCRGRAFVRQVGHLVLAFGRAQPHRHVGPQAGCSAGNPRAVPGDLDQGARHSGLRAPAAASQRSWTSCRSFARSIARPATTRRSRCRPATRWPGGPTTATTARGYPSMGSIAAKFRGPNDPGMPAFVGLADSWKADVWGAGHMGQPNMSRSRQGADRPAGHAPGDQRRPACRIATSCAGSSTG